MRLTSYETFQSIPKRYAEKQISDKLFTQIIEMQRLMTVN